MGFKRKLRWLILVLMPLLLFTGCGDLESEIQDTRTVILNMDFDQRSSSRTSSVSLPELSQYNTHLIISLPSWENLHSSYWTYSGFTSYERDEGLRDPSSREVTLEIPLYTQMRVFAFLFTGEYDNPDLLFSAQPDVGLFGKSDPFEIDAQTNSLIINGNRITPPSLVITLCQNWSWEGVCIQDTTAPTASVTTATITTSGSAVVKSTETGKAYLVNDTITVSNLDSITGAANNQWNIIYISSAETDTNLPATGLADGTYRVYAVDAAGNLSSASSNSVTVRDFSISSSDSDNASVAFGQTYQYQLTTSGTYTGTITYSLSNEPDNMTISSSGLVEWTPNKASEIKTNSNITITLTTANGYILTQTYDLTVTGTCTPGTILGIWSGDQRNSINSTKFLGNISSYTDNASTRKTASQNYNLSGNSANIIFGPTAEVNKGSVFFYQQYDNTTHLYFNFFFGVEGGSDTENQYANLDIFTSKNTSEDYVIVMDDKAAEFSQYDNSSANSLYSASYKGRFRWKGNTDGGVVGPFSGSDFKVYMILRGTSTINSDTLSLCVSAGSCLTSMNYFSKDNSTVSLGDMDDFTVGYKATIDCSN